jgi:hypothetical protein
MSLGTPLSRTLYSSGSGLLFSTARTTTLTFSTYDKKNNTIKSTSIRFFATEKPAEKKYKPIPYRTPDKDIASTLPRRFQELSNETLSLASLQSFFGARRERLLREIMRVDDVNYDQALRTLEKINQASDKYAWAVTLPYKFGLTVGVVSALSAMPLVFHKPTALWFNEHFVHESLPEGGIESLDTIWKVGNWTWGWMEPYLGTASFVLLGLQFARVHLQKMNMKPYTEWILSKRANRLANLFPQYERQIVRDFAKSDPWHG